MRKLYITLFINFFVVQYCFATTDSDKLKFPFIKGEVNFYDQFAAFISRGYPINDSASIFFVEVKYNRKSKRIQNRILFSSESSSNNEFILNFFESVNSNWNYRLLRQASLIIPVMIVTYCSLEGKGVVDWNRINASVNSFSGLKSLVNMVKPITIYLYCGSID